MPKSSAQRKAQAAWSRIEDLGGHGVWELELCAIVLAGTKISDDDLKLLHDLPFVHILDLSNTSITDAALAYLDSVVDLDSLDLVNTKFTKAAIAAFKVRNPSVSVQTEPSPKDFIDPFTGKPRNER